MQLFKRFDVLKSSGCIEGELARVQSEISSQFSGAFDPSVKELIDSFGTLGGKMLRPTLVLLSGLACGDIREEHIRTAAVIELIHNATLLHDDVIDEGRLRRNLPTINSLRGNETAVLLGDFLLSRVFRMCSDLPSWITGEISQTAVRTCEGELRQIVHKGDWQLSQKEYFQIITEKSAALFSTSCKLGGALAGGSDTEVDALREFGLHFGIAYQLTDDLIDVVGDEEKAGKTLGGDLEKTKPTLPLIHLLSTLSAIEREAFIKKLNDGTVDKSYLTEQLSFCGSIEYGQNCAKGLVDEAQEFLEKLRETEAKEALVEISRCVSNEVA